LHPTGRHIEDYYEYMKVWRKYMEIDENMSLLLQMNY